MDLCDHTSIEWGEIESLGEDMIQNGKCNDCGIGVYDVYTYHKRYGIIKGEHIEI